MTSADGTTTTRRPIVAGVDGSESSLAALRWAMRQAELTGAPLEIVSAWEWPVSWGWQPPIPPGYDPADEARRQLDKAISAKGGLAKLRGIKTVRSEGTVTAQSAGGPIPFGIVTSIEYPERYRVDADTPGGKVAQVYADGRYWIQDARGVNEMPPAAQGPIQSSVQRDIVRVLLKAA